MGQEITLADHSDFELAEEARRREVALQEAIAEIERRRSDRGQPQWDERTIASHLVRKRADHHWHPQIGEQCPIDLPPPLFRMGYEWAALSLFAILDRILDRPSDEIYSVSTFAPTGRGLYRMVGKPKVSDKRRRAALDLIEMLERFFKHSDLFVVKPRRRSTYTAADDQAPPPPKGGEAPSALLGK